MSAKLNRGGSMTASQRKRKEAAEFESGVPVLLNVRYLGDVVDRPKYLIGDYDDRPGYEVRLSKKGKGESFGFDLTSMTSLRGHFIEAVSKGSRAEEAGMARGDMVRTVNGHKAVDMTHTTLVDFMTGLADRGQEIVMGMARSPTEE